MKKLIHIVITASITVFLLPPLLIAQEMKSHPHSFSLEYGYLPLANDNKAIARFGLEAYQGYSFLFDLGSEAINNNTAGFAQAILRSLYWVTSYYVGLYGIDMEFKLAYHEFGHASRSLAAGYEPSMIFTDDHEDAAGNDRAARYNNFFSYFFASYGHLGYGGQSRTGEQLEDYGDNTPSYWGDVVTMNGANHNIYFSELLTDEIFAGRGHVVTAMSYFINRLEFFQYVRSEEEGDLGVSGGDMKAIEDYYRSRGHNITFRDIKIYNVISVFLSSASYAYIYGVFNYLFTGDSRIPSMNLYGVRLPDMAMYATHWGITYKISSGYRTKNWLFPVAVEFTIEGQRRAEVTVGVGRIYGDYILQAGLAISDAVSYYASAGRIFRLGGNGICVTLGLNHYDIRTFEGERHIPSLKSGYLYSNTYVLRVSFLY